MNLSYALLSFAFIRDQRGIFPKVRFPMPGLSEEKSRALPGRSAVILLVVLLFWCAIIAKLISLQVIDYNFYLEQAVDNVQHTTKVTGERGIIYDTNGVQLATNYSVYRVFISPYDMADRSNEEIVETLAPDAGMVELISSGLSEILGVDKGSIIEKCQKTHRKDETIKKNVESEDADKVLAFIAEHELDRQIHLEASTKRYYPGGTLASHLIGVVGTDGGLIGLEMQYDSYLTGTTIKYLSAKDSLGKNMPYKYDSYIDASGGANMITTIDENIQRILEEQAKAAFHDAMPLNRVTAIAMNPSSGGVYGMATYPTFDLNQPYVLTEDLQAKLDATGYPSTFSVSEEIEKQLNLSRYETIEEKYNAYYYHLVYSMWKNKAVSELYEPGSTFKIITTATSLEENIADLSFTYTCTGSYRVTGYPSPIRCHKRSGHGTLDFAGALQHSCNPSMMRLSERLGRSTFYQYFKAFGYTEKTGIDLPGEATAVFHNYDSFNQTELAVYSFGQTFKITPIRQLASICAVANGGYLVSPYVVEQIVDNDGKVLYTHDTKQHRQVISSEVCKTISSILEGGVSGDGGAKNAYVPGYKIAAKTGTSEIRDVVNPITGEKDYRVGSTVAYAPSDDPKIAVLLLVDMPQVEKTSGSMVAAPYVANIMNEVLPYLGVERSYSDAELKKLAVDIRNYTGWPIDEAEKEIQNRGLKCEIIGDGTVVQQQIPAGGSSLSKENGRVLLYTGGKTPKENITMPNVEGMTLTNANKLLTGYGLNICVKGPDNGSAGATVTNQDIPAGTRITKGTLVTLTLRYMDGTAN